MGFFTKLLPAGGCKGKTKDGSPCSGRNVFENGFCKHHGGEGMDLRARRFAVYRQFIEKEILESDERLKALLARNPMIETRIRLEKNGQGS